jgi:predicted short-subunit dehydrogenase-like oxidoreductase (DUF2520 family)
MNIVFIGAGNVATHLALALKNIGHNIVQVFSRTLVSAKTLANNVNAEYTNELKDLTTNSDIYFYTVPDDALPLTIENVPSKKGIHIHTAGSISMDIFTPFQYNYGVLYPLQTFSKNKNINIQEVPFLLEANNKYVKEILIDITKNLSNKFFEVNSQERQRIHLSAVFACNFTNHLYAQAEKILAQVNLPFSDLLSLVDETTQKVHTLSPAEAQTGPAIRHDWPIIEKHLAQLKGKEKTIYQLLTESIQNDQL